MTFPTHTLRTHKQLLVLLLWIAFIGWAIWQHAQQSQLPPVHDALAYYQKAYNFWAEVHQHKLFNPFNVEPTFRPPGTILMSYPFGFDPGYQGFYFRSIFLPIAFFSLAVVISSYRRELDSRSKWHLVLFAAFLSSLPCLYSFEPSPEPLPAASYWGHVDNFLAGVAALATAATVRSLWTRSLAWLVLGAVLSSFCLSIKPSGALVMMLIGLTWFCLTLIQLKSVWSLPNERKSTTRWLLRGMIIFAVPYLLILTVAFTSNYLSPQNLAVGNAALDITHTEEQLSKTDLISMAHLGLGYPFVAGLLLAFILVVNYLWRAPSCSFPWSRAMLIGFAVASCISFVFGIWFWIFGAGAPNQIRYFIPFAFMAAILALPAILTAMRAISDRKMVILSVLMTAPIINLGMLLPQRNASIEWQKWTGVNLTSGVYDPVLDQAQNFATAVKHEGRNVAVYSISLNVADSRFQSVIDHASFAMPPMPTVSTVRPIDWQRPSTYRKREMLDADYWLFLPVRDPHIARAILDTLSIDNLHQEIMLFQTWATQLTTNDGVTVVSDTPMARVLRITDSTLLESAFDALVAKHHWRNTFIDANPKRRFSEKELAAALVLTPPSLENINFGGRFHLRALSVSRMGDDTTVLFWWKPLSPIPEHDWLFFIHSIDDEGKVVLNHNVIIRFNRSLSSLDGALLFDRITFKNPDGNGTHRLAIGFYRPNQAVPTADKGTRDWDNRRVIVPLH